MAGQRPVVWPIVASGLGPRSALPRPPVERRLAEKARSDAVGLCLWSAWLSGGLPAGECRGGRSRTSGERMRAPSRALLAAARAAQRRPRACGAGPRASARSWSEPSRWSRPDAECDHGARKPESAHGSADSARPPPRRASPSPPRSWSTYTRRSPISRRRGKSREDPTVCEKFRSGAVRRPLQGKPRRTAALPPFLVLVSFWTLRSDVPADAIAAKVTRLFAESFAALQQAARSWRAA